MNSAAWIAGFGLLLSIIALGISVDSCRTSERIKSEVVAGNQRQDPHEQDLIRLEAGGTRVYHVVAQTPYLVFVRHIPDWETGVEAAGCGEEDIRQITNRRQFIVPLDPYKPGEFPTVYRC